MRVRLGYGVGFLELEVGQRASLILPRELPAAGPGEIERSLDSPIGKGLEELGGCRSASILVSDITRPAPTHLMLPPLARRLRQLGISEITIVFALGTHRRMTEEEERQLLGDCISMPHIQHDTSSCTHLGETRRGTPVEILEAAASSDLIIGTGNIEYHYYAGYSGGAKSLLPGISSERSVVRNHELMRDPRSVTGRLDSPVREDMEEAARIAGLDLILNVVCLLYTSDA
ncbi:MAG: lactate racemase domain-containing protein, partial [Methanothrix sp.]|nr:lactate racemase domain-containing protein [Methanothrix sp.]